MYICACASCGIPGGGGIKLKSYNASTLVKCCSFRFQRKQQHRSQHERTCKKKSAELRDELQFKQPECTNLLVIARSASYRSHLLQQEGGRSTLLILAAKKMYVMAVHSL
eukprot:scaffold204_cov135-Skeletonema_menzelii.AAC.12